MKEREEKVGKELANQLANALKMFPKAFSSQLKKKDDTAKIKKVKYLVGKEKILATRMGLNPEDLVIVLPESLEKIVGDSVTYLIHRSREITKLKDKESHK